MGLNFGEFAELIDNLDGTYTFISPDEDVADVSFAIVDPTGDVTFEGNVTFEGGIIFGSAFITPILTADVDDYLIPEFRDFTSIVWRSTKNIDVSGIDASGLNETHVWIFSNGNTNGKKFKFKMNDGGSLVNNRFAGKNDLTIEQDEFWWFLRNAATNKFNGQAKV